MIFRATFAIAMAVVGIGLINDFQPIDGADLLGLVLIVVGTAACNRATKDDED